MSPNFSSGGLDTFDLLGDLSPNERTLTRILLRYSKMTEKDIYNAIAELPPEKRMNSDQMKAALRSLGEKGWVNTSRFLFSKVYTIQQKKNR